MSASVYDDWQTTVAMAWVPLPTSLYILCVGRVRDEDADDRVKHTCRLFAELACKYHTDITSTNEDCPYVHTATSSSSSSAGPLLSFDQNQKKNLTTLQSVSGTQRASNSEAFDTLPCTINAATTVS